MAFRDGSKQFNVEKRKAWDYWMSGKIYKMKEFRVLIEFTDRSHLSFCSSRRTRDAFWGFITAWLPDFKNMPPPPGHHSCHFVLPQSPTVPTFLFFSLLASPGFPETLWNMAFALGLFPNWVSLIIQMRAYKYSAKYRSHLQNRLNECPFIPRWIRQLCGPVFLYMSQVFQAEYHRRHVRIWTDHRCSDDQSSLWQTAPNRVRKG